MQPSKMFSRLKSTKKQYSVLMDIEESKPKKGFNNFEVETGIIAETSNLGYVLINC